MRVPQSLHIFLYTLRIAVPLILFLQIQACVHSEKTYPTESRIPLPSYFDEKMNIIIKTEDILVYPKDIPSILNAKVGFFGQSERYTVMFFFFNFKNYKIDSNNVERALLCLRRAHATYEWRDEVSFQPQVYNINKGLVLKDAKGIRTPHGHKPVIKAEETDDEYAMMRESKEGFPGISYYGSPVDGNIKSMKFGIKEKYRLSKKIYKEYLFKNNTCRRVDHHEKDSWDIIDITKEIRQELEGDRIALIMIRNHCKNELTAIYYYSFQSYKITSPTPLEIKVVPDNIPFLHIKLKSRPNIEKELTNRENDILFCKYCGFDLKKFENSKFCPKCGGKLLE